ncbi:MAG: response regulator [Gemmatimonadales bacterium]|nr:MAG: response regulator [Gemmatimonadales bacterium]
MTPDSNDNETSTPPLVLVVEDDPTVQGFIVRTLKRHGYVCLTAGSAEEALRVSSEADRPVDLLVLDIMLPDSWGTRLMQDVRAQHEDVRVILTSGYTSEDPILAAGVDARDPDIPFLEKPFAPDGLLEAVRTALSTRRGPATASD